MKFLRLKFPATFEVDPGKVNGWTRTKYDFHLTLIEFRVAETIWESVMDYFFEITSNHPWILSLADLNFNCWDLIERPNQTKLAVLTPERPIEVSSRQALLVSAFHHFGATQVTPSKTPEGYPLWIYHTPNNNDEPLFICSQDDRPEEWTPYVSIYVNSSHSSPSPEFPLALVKVIPDLIIESSRVD